MHALALVLNYTYLHVQIIYFFLCIFSFTPVHGCQFYVISVHEVIKGKRMLAFLALEKEFGWLFIYDHAQGVQHTERAVHIWLQS